MKQDYLKPVYILILILIIFAVYGIYASTFGPLASSIMSYYKIDTGQNGLILSLQNIRGFLCALLCIFLPINLINYFL